MLTSFYLKYYFVFYLILTYYTYIQTYTNILSFCHSIFSMYYLLHLLPSLSLRLSDCYSVSVELSESDLEIDC